jgi:hypothetical protein
LATSLRDDVQITQGILAAAHKAGAAGGQRGDSLCLKGNTQ